MGTATKVDKEMAEMEGIYQCPHCHGHVMLDATFLDQVGLIVNCPYCPEKIEILED